MNYKIVNGSITYGAETILEEINFEIKEKDKIAIVGRNGCGKTTLLKAIVDNSMLEEGIGEEKFGIYKQGSPIIGYLKQIEFEDSNCTMLEEILKVYKPILQLEEKITKLAKEMENNSDEKVIKEYTNALEKFELQDGYTYKKEYETAIKKFGFTEEDKHRKVNQFSGGQRTKIAFLKLLLSKPDILLLDEPTNHLDITAIEWLENYLKSYKKSVVIVSHDRMFLDRIVNKVYEIEYAELKEYKGNYAEFEKQKRENYEKQLKDYEYQQAEIKRLQAIADRFRYKPTKAKMALSKLKQIERMTIIDEPNKYDLKTFHANFNLEQGSGKTVLTVKNLKIGYDKPLAEVSFELFRGQKLAIIGENGIGKSTLLKTLNGDIEKIDGNFEYGYHVKKGPNLLLLDEPTNHMDIVGKESLENILKEYKGTLIFVSHDRYFVNKIADSILEFEKDKVTYFNGSYEEYMEFKQKEEAKKDEIDDVEKKISLQETKEQTPNQYFINKEKNKIKNKISKLENEINEKEDEIKNIEAEMLKEENSTDYVKLKELQEKVERLNEEIESKMAEWEMLSAKLES